MVRTEALARSESRRKTATPRTYSWAASPDSIAEKVMERTERVVEREVNTIIGKHHCGP